MPTVNVLASTANLSQVAHSCTHGHMCFRLHNTRRTQPLLMQLAFASLTKAECLVARIICVKRFHLTRASPRPPPHSTTFPAFDKVMRAGRCTTCSWCARQPHTHPPGGLTMVCQQAHNHYAPGPVRSVPHLPSHISHYALITDPSTHGHLGTLLAHATSQYCAAERDLVEHIRQQQQLLTKIAVP